MLGVDEKIVRAQVHLGTLESEILTYLERSIIEFPSHLKRNEHTVRVFFNVLIEPPIPLSIIVGDVVHNTRTSLDHLWGALTRSDKGGFPCEKDPVRWRDTKAESLRSLPKGAPAIIEGLQPCSGTDDGRLLGALNQLSNRDKHKTINLTAAESVNSQLVLLSNCKDQPSINIALPGSFHPNTYVEVTDLPEEIMEGGVRVKLNGRLVVAFKESPLAGESVRDVLKHMINAVRDRIVPALRPFVKI